MKFKYSVLNVVINQPNMLLFISALALMPNMLELRTDYELLHILQPLFIHALSWQRLHVGSHLLIVAVTRSTCAQKRTVAFIAYRIHFDRTTRVGL